MDKSFFVVPDEKKTGNPNILRNTGFTSVLRRKEVIDAICDETDRGYLTEYPHIAKLCRRCITDITNELVEKSNWETTRYKRYTESLEGLRRGESACLVGDARTELIEDLEINITDSKFLHERYKMLYEKLKKMKLYTKGCYICEEVNAV